MIEKEGRIWYEHLVLKLELKKSRRLICPKPLRYSLAGRQKLEEAGLEYEGLTSTGTPRRLVLYLSGLAETQPDSVREVKGPRVSRPMMRMDNPPVRLRGLHGLRSEGRKICS